jgi:lipopolysaccharide assembly outer membrane protein LptD (OstA)
MFHTRFNENCRGAVIRSRRLKRLQQLLIFKRGIWPAFLGCFILGVLAGPNPAVAQILELKKEHLLEDDAGTAWVLEADELTYDHQLNQYIARGNVQIFTADKMLSADLPGATWF